MWAKITTSKPVASRIALLPELTPSIDSENNWNTTLVHDMCIVSSAASEKAHLRMNCVKESSHSLLDQQLLSREFSNLKVIPAVTSTLKLTS